LTEFTAVLALLGLVLLIYGAVYGLSGRAVVFQQLAGQAILERVAPCASGVTFDVHNE
jgi:hypothetical protein